MRKCSKIYIRNYCKGVICFSCRNYCKIFTNSCTQREIENYTCYRPMLICFTHNYT